MKTSYSNEFVVAYIKNIRKYQPWPIGTALLALTYRCQCECIHCGVALYRKIPEEELTSNEVIRLIDEIKKLGVIMVYFFGGEPLIVPQLVSYIKYAKNKGLKVRVGTNGLLLDETMVRRLKEADRDLIIDVSLDSSFEKLHDKLRGVKGVFKRAIAGIRYCKEHNLGCLISTYATKNRLKSGELKKIIDLAKSFNIGVRILSPILVGNWMKYKELALSAKEIKLLRGLLEKNKVCWENDLIDSKEVPFFCRSFNKSLFFISPYGDIQPCCYFPITFGNIREKPLDQIIKEMWSSGMFIDYANHKCHDCPFNERAFIHKYKVLFESHGKFPKRYSQI